MRSEQLTAHLHHPFGRGRIPPGAHTGAAGGGACGDLVRVSLALDEHGRIEDAGFDANGCGTAIAAGSATVSLVRGTALLDAARVGTEQVAAELGGLSPGKRHAAELAADALHRALGLAARAAALPVAENRTLVAMSGGVDSAVAALLVADAGDAVAVTLELWSDPENDGERSCCSAQAVRGARDLAHRLGMPHFALDLRAEFRAGVVRPWLNDHAAGLTPNPCVRCNGSVRLDAMLDLARRLGGGALATGHYARRSEAERPLLRVAADAAKDQSYMLAALDPRSLAGLRFPLGGMTKPEVRALAHRAGLPVARKPDSQDLCFLAGTGRRDFLARHGGLARRPGEIVDQLGAPVGCHDGHHGFTVGQRRGLNVGGSRQPLYVLGTNAQSNTVTVGPREALETTRVSVRQAVLHREGSAVNAVRLRYHSPAVPCRLTHAAVAGNHGRLELALERPASGAAPGQLACLMSGDLVVGHATIAVAG